MKENDTLQASILQAVQKSLQEEASQVRPASKPLTHNGSQIRVPNLMPKTAQVAGKKRQRTAKQVSGEWNAEASQAERISMSQAPPQEASSEAELAPKRVQRLCVQKPRDMLKEMTRLQGLSRRKMGKVSKGSQVTQEEGARSDQDQLWRDLMKPHEERVFQIDRTT